MLVRSLPVLSPGRRRRLVPVAVSLLLLAGASGCAEQPGSAAVIDGHTITTRSVDNDAQAALTAQSLSATNPANSLALIQVARTQLTGQIQHDLLQRANASSAKPVTDEDVSAIITQVGAAQLAEQLQVTQEEVPARVKDFIALRNLLSAAIQAQTPVTDVSLTISLASYPDRAAAVAARAGFLARPDTFDQVLAEQAAAQGQPTPEPQQITLQRAPTVISSGLFAVPAGSFVVVTGNDTTFLVRVDSRELTKSPLPSSLLDPNEQVPDTVVEALGGLLLADQVDASQVQVNPRYGTWDPITAQVVPGLNAL
ncbi:hypothetical protein D1871_11790 [Nakamurella silvestris]|nr:hypothetical protein D1871_11790 [Nakamurella silvestris]